MKERIIYLLMSVVLVAFSSCTKDDESKSPFDNVTYIEQAKVQDYDNVFSKRRSPNDSASYRPYPHIQ